MSYYTNWQVILCNLSELLCTIIKVRFCLAGHKTRFNPLFCAKTGTWQLLSNISFLCIFAFVLIALQSSLGYRHPELFSSNRFKTYYCCLYLCCHIKWDNLVCHISGSICAFVQARALASPTTRFNPPFFFLKCPIPSQKNGNCFLMVRFCVCCIVIWFFVALKYFCCFVIFLLNLTCFPQFKFVTRMCFIAIDLRLRTEVYYCCLYLGVMCAI